MLQFPILESYYFTQVVKDSTYELGDLGTSPGYLVHMWIIWFVIIFFTIGWGQGMSHREINYIKKNFKYGQKYESIYISMIIILSFCFSKINKGNSTNLIKVP